MQNLTQPEASELTLQIRTIGQQARSAATSLAKATTAAKNHALLAMAAMLLEQNEVLQSENAKDIEAAQAQGLAAALVDRLRLTPARIEAMADGLRQIAALPDPVGEIAEMAYRPSGIQVGRMRVPLGVIGIIYESRPNVTADAAGLCIKSGNATILRGGSEAFHSNQAIAVCVQAGLRQAELPATAVQVIATTDRQAVGEMLQLTDAIDVIVPRGGKGLIERISRESRIPVIKHLDGVCHVYIDAAADLAMAKAIAVNAKTQRFGTCNTMETLLVNVAVAERCLPDIAAAMLAAGVELRGCQQTCDLVPQATLAGEVEWRTEYLAPILAIRVVPDLDAAIEHINTYGSQHTDSIVTENVQHAWRFLRDVDSSSVMLNASTRFADGFEYGLGAEIGISTDKLHARGPVGLEGLTSQKFIVLGQGQIRT